MNTENVVIAIIVAAAVLYLLRWLYRSLIRPASKGDASSCDSCPECETTRATESTGTARSESKGTL